ncbi:MAG: hypothetical protein GY820_44805 [Gammaproteobacteria bacterium]|nr:hypothetical protein [Gammaproteobacteria bacterium]
MPDYRGNRVVGGWGKLLRHSVYYAALIHPTKHRATLANSPQLRGRIQGGF